MTPITVAAAILFALATAPLLVLAWRHGSRPAALGASVLWLSTLAVGYVAAREMPRLSAAERHAHLRPLEVEGDGYVQSDKCQSCHPGEYDSWFGSYHRTMTTAATPENVKAPWDGEEVVARGVRYVFERRGDEYWVEFDEPTWDRSLGPAPRIWRQVVQVTGSHHWQFFWYATGETRVVHILLCAYRLRGDLRWMPLDGCCISPPAGGQESGTARWSRVCNRCHSTHGRPRIRAWDHMDTHVAELGIACEACHGPGEAHVAANKDPRARYAKHFAGTGDETIVNPGKLDHRRASHVCGNCHAVSLFRNDEDRSDWREHGYKYRPGDLVTETREFMQGGGEDRFWSDGVVRVSGREFNGLIETPCYQRGEMGCMSCHQMHKRADDTRPFEEWSDDQLGPGMDGDQACTQCHAEYTERARVEEHTHHPFEASGARCYNCHMPYTTYGLLKGIRSHVVTSPSAHNALETGRPTACNLCHLDKTLEWTGEQLAEWYGHERPDLDFREREVSALILTSLRGDAAQRAISMWAMGWDPAREASGTEWMTPFLSFLLNDPYHAVRYLAWQAGKKQADAAALGGYDFLADHESMDAISRNFYAAWLGGTAKRNRQRDAALLMSPDGTPKLSEIELLLSQRDDTPVTLNE